MKQKVTLKKVNGTDSYSNPVVSETKTINCKLNFQNKTVKNRQGLDIVSRAKLVTSEPISLNDLIGYDGKDWPVIQVSPIADFNGEIFQYEVYF